MKVKFNAVALMLLVLVAISAGFYTAHQHKLERQSTRQAARKVISKAKSELPAAKQSDWDLVLVNRTHEKEEMNPKVTTLGNIEIDSRIADSLKQFLAAAQKIDPQEHLISGYRSVDYQSQVFQSYVEQEEANDPSLTDKAAVAKVETYSQPPKSSEHQTGLAVDMSTVDSLDQSDPKVVAQVAKIAPDYGFVLRFPKDGSKYTGVDYEDWHYRYVGVANAKYMVAHNLTLEQYLDLLPK